VSGVTFSSAQTSSVSSLSDGSVLMTRVYCSYSAASSSNCREVMRLADANKKAWQCSVLHHLLHYLVTPPLCWQVQHTGVEPFMPDVVHQGVHSLAMYAPPYAARP